MTTTEEAIKTLKENCCAMCAYGSQDMDSCDIRGCDNRDAIKALEQELCWIPVSERLPKSSGVYVVSRWFSDGEESVILTDANYYDGNGDWYNDNRINWGRDLVTDKIVAWMPLPTPYKADSEGASE